MKTKRTLRTIARSGINSDLVGFVGVPTGKYVRTLAKQKRLARALLAKLPAGVWNGLARSNPGMRQLLKAATIYVASMEPEGWIEKA